jgi:hypothetical protein
VLRATWQSTLAPAANPLPEAAPRAHRSYLRDRAAGARAVAADGGEGYFFARAGLEALRAAVEEAW